MARQDGPGSPNFGTTAASQNRHNTIKGIIPAGTKTNPNAMVNRAKTQFAGTQVYRYPADGYASFPARMRFSLHQVDAYTVTTSSLKSYFDIPLIDAGIRGENLSDNAKASYGATEKDVADFGNQEDFKRAGVDVAVAAKDKQANDDVKKSNGGITDVKTKRVTNSPIIQMYMPQSLVFNDDVAYGQSNLGPGGLTAIGALNAGSSLTGAVARGISEGMESIFNLATGQISGAAASVAAARATQFIPKVGLRTAAATALQVGINPGTRTMFEQPNIRNFTFTFRLISTSSAEATQIEKIIQTFREEMYPETIDMINGVPAGYKFPNLFKIEFDFIGAKAKVPMIQFSYLRSCQVTYNPNSMVFHADGQPTEVDMTLVFQEYRALSKQDIQKGY
jgi:hypothetical protein